MNTKAGNRLVDYPAYRLHYKIDNPRHRRGPDLVALRFLTPLGKQAITLGREFVGWAEAKRRVTKEGLTLRWDFHARGAVDLKLGLRRAGAESIEGWQISFGILADRLRDEGVEVTVLADTSYTTESGVYVPKSQVKTDSHWEVSWASIDCGDGPRNQAVEGVPFVRLTLK